MSWPTMSDYQEAIQNPVNCFTDAALKAGMPALNALGLPQPVTGGFCSVYQVASGKSRWAVRCFLHNIEDIRDRYSKISGYLRGNRVKHMVGFEYVSQGIKVRKDWHPVLKMEWVDGDTLDVWIEKHLGDPGALRKLADRWQVVLKDLEHSHLGHCDLQHGNILVDRTNDIRLIDYDGMYVPPLKGRGSHEKGHPAYQHPERDGKDFDERVDRFPALVIHTTLLAVAQQPALWKKYYEGDNLIFHRSDFQNSKNAGIFDELAALGGDVAKYSEALRRACSEKLEKTPRLREVLGGPEGAPAKEKRSGGGLGFLGKLFAKPPRTEASKAAAPKPAAARVQAPAPAPAPSARVAAAQKKPKLVAVPQTALAPPAMPGAGSAAVKAMPRPSVPVKAGALPKSAARLQLVSAAKPSSQPAAPATKARAKSRAATAPPRAKSRQASGKATSGSASALTAEWIRPGAIHEEHVWFSPNYAIRDAERRILGISFGMKKEKYIESWDEQVEQRATSIEGHRAVVSALAFSSDGRLLASGSKDGTLRVWSVMEGREAFAPLETCSGIVALAFAPDRSLIAVTLEDRRLLLYDYGRLRQVIHLRAPDRSALKAVTVSDDGRFVAAGGGSRRIHVWQTGRGEIDCTLARTTGRIEALAFTPDGGGVVCGTHKGRVELFDRASGKPRWSTRTGLPRIVAIDVPSHADGLVGAAADGTVGCWDLTAGSEKRRVRPMRQRLTSLAVAPDASHLLVGYASGTAFVTEAGSDRSLATLEGHPGAVTATALSSVGPSAATGTTDGTVRLWMLRRAAAGMAIAA